ncbi:MAG: GyrI-like domain-containing protein [Chloroflexota bacterium]|nr:GyrI-like domain-containing protein [Chloroflexota bacterium]
MIEPEIIQRDAFTLVGVEAPFIGALSPDANNFEVIPPLWDQFVDRIEEIKHRSDKACYGLVLTPPVGDRSHPDELLYVAGAVVSEVSSVPEGMVRHEVPAATYAVFTHRGPIANLPETIRFAMEVWLPRSGYRWNLIEVERYDHRFSIELPQESEMETWLGIVPADD